MIYDFEKHTPKLDPNCWVAPNAVVIGRVELKKDSNVLVIGCEGDTDQEMYQKLLKE